MTFVTGCIKLLKTHICGLISPLRKKMSAYKPPKVGDNKVIYKGKRYWVIELTGKDQVDGFGPDFCQFVMYDKLYQATLATITTNKNGTFRASLMSHIELWYDNDTMDELIQTTPYYADAYYKACGG